MPYYNQSAELPEIIIADVRMPDSSLQVKYFTSEQKFFGFLNDTAETALLEVEHIWKYRSGGALSEQKVEFKGKLRLVDCNHPEQV